MEASEEQKPFVVDNQNGRKRGRKPAKSPTITEKPADPPTPFDTPAAPIVSSQPDRANVPPKPKRELPPEQFFRYWASIPERERSEWFKCYVYRGLPVCDVTQTLTPEELRLIAQQKMRKPEVNVAKLTEPIDPDHWREHILNKYGAGDYGFRLNDQHPSVKQSICFTTIDKESGGIEFRDWDSYPPVLDPKEVVLTEESNESYIRWARLKGIKFPGDAEIHQATREGEETEMASVVETITRHNETLQDKVVELSEKLSRPPVANPSPAPDAAARAQLGGVETVVEASKAGMKIMGDAMSKVLESSVRNSDPAERLKESIEIAKLIAPAPAAKDNSSSEMLAFLRMQTAGEVFHASDRIRTTGAQRDAGHAEGSAGSAGTQARARWRFRTRHAGRRNR
jgi:hypothetical protein